MSERTVYLVQRRAWTADTYQPYLQRFDHRPGHVPLRAFADRGRAEDWARELEVAARTEVSCPFVFGDHLDDWSSLGLKTVQARLRKIGVRQPEVVMHGSYGEIDWQAWWARVGGDLNDRQRIAIWDMLDRLRFYEVVERTLVGQTF